MTTTDEDRAAGRSDTPRPGTHHPHLARERALKVLFQADIRGTDPRVLLDRVVTERGALELLDELEPDADQLAGDEDLRFELVRRSRLPLDDYTRTLVVGVAARLRAIDALLEQVSDRWSVRRMPAVDRNILRMAVYELAEQDTPPAVVIDEAVSLAGGFAGEKARPFVNGVLETIRKAIARGEVALEVPAAVSVPSERPVEHAAAEPTGDDEPAPRGVITAPVPVVEEDPAAERAWHEALDLLDAVEDELDEDDEDDELDADDPDDELAAEDDDEAPLGGDELIAMYASVEELRTGLDDEDDFAELASSMSDDEDDLW